MVQLFDKFDNYEIPTFILCNPDYSELFAIPAYDRHIVLRYNDVSELTFNVPSKTDGTGEENIECFDWITVRRLVLVESIGYFQITDVSDVSDGNERYKSCTCKSIQYELSGKKAEYLNGTYKFYDTISNYDENGNPNTMVGYIMKYAPDWQIGEVDSELQNKYRTVDISDNTLLDFIYNTLEEAFQCICEFDILNKTISFKAVKTLVDNPYNTDIYISYDNLLKNIKINEYSDEIKTKLYVYGQDIDIRQVNPIGTAYVINVDHYMTTEWMPQDLINAINIWKAKIENGRSGYGAKLTALHDRQSELTALQSELADTQGELKEQENLLSVKIEHGLTGDTDYTDVLSEINTIKNVISSKEAEIQNKHAQISSLKNEIAGLVESYKLESNFSAEQLAILNKYLYEETYTNDNYVVTDLMSADTIQEYAEELYSEGEAVLKRISQPRYTFEIDSNNFVFMKEYLHFTNQLEAGRMLYVEGKNGEIFYPILLEIDINYDDIESFSLKFGNRFRLVDNTYTYSELLDESQSVSSKISANWNSIIEFSRRYKNEVGDLINNAFNVALREIINSSNQEQVWDSSGMTFRKLGESGGYEDEQVKIVNNKIVFTDDGWNSVKTVLGKIALSENGNTWNAYGLAAEAIVGKLLAGENLVITNADNTFRIDENGLSFVTGDNSGNQELTSVTDYITDLLQTIDGGAESFYQEDSPHDEYTNIASNNDYDKYIGDIWYNSDDGKSYIYIKSSHGSNFNYEWKEINSIPEGLIDKIDGKKSIFTQRPTSFSKNDIWIYEGKYDQTNNSYSRLVESDSPNSGFYQAPYAIVEGQKVYFKKNDMLIATDDSSDYDASKWKKYSTNIEKKGNNFEFTLNDEGAKIKNGDIEVEKGNNIIVLNAAEGIKIQKRDNASSPYTDQFYADSNGSLVLKGIIQATDFRTTDGTSMLKNNGKIKEDYLDTSSRVGKNEVIASINNSGETVTINADRINFTGFTTFLRATDLSATGSTVIDGNRIETGTLSGDKIIAGTLQVDRLQATSKHINGQSSDCIGLANSLYFSDYGLDGYNRRIGNLHAISFTEVNYSGSPEGACASAIINMSRESAGDYLKDNLVTTCINGDITFNSYNGNIIFNKAPLVYDAISNTYRQLAMIL